MSNKATRIAVATIALISLVSFAAPADAAQTQTQLRKIDLCC